MLVRSRVTGQFHDIPAGYLSGRYEALPHAAFHQAPAEPTPDAAPSNAAPAEPTDTAPTAPALPQAPGSNARPAPAGAPARRAMQPVAAEPMMLTAGPGM